MSNFHSKNISSITGMSRSHSIINIPKQCPHCLLMVDPIPSQYYDFNYSDENFLAVSFKCPSCDKHYVCTFLSDDESSSYCCKNTYPSSHYVLKDKILENISPRFVDMYNQALLCEHNQHFDLSSIGYRAALEILVKDFAINTLNKDSVEVKKHSLYTAIKEYLNCSDLIKSADVVRILGNDYAHYERKYPEHDFDVLKSYMDIFMSIMISKYKVLNPPVCRD